MLHMSSTAAPIQGWQNTLQRGDTVLFRFPCTADHQQETPKKRTCLVVEIETRDGRRFAELAYGTSVNTAANTGDEIRLGTPAQMSAAGVSKPTRFVCARRVAVALDHPGWDVNPRHPSPVIGHLPPRELERLDAIRARIHALRDIAAERRRERIETRRPRTRDDFVVEHRRRRSARPIGKGAAR